MESITNLHYKIVIRLEEKFYTGLVELSFNTNNDFQQLKLNNKKIKIIKVSINNLETKDYNVTKDLLVINSKFINGKHKVLIQYENNIKNNMFGLYYANIKDEIIYTTQFEPEYARNMFPCIDQPSVKSTYQLGLFHNSKDIALSNTNIESQEIINGMTRTIFKKTPKMSTYLLAFAVGNLHSIYDNYNDIKIGVHSHKSIEKEKLKYALEKNKFGLRFYEDWFKIKYELNKLDIISVPDFSAGAMENWGLITFRDTYLLTSKYMSNQDRLSVENVIYHELVHQWFGNLATMKDWSCLWLNEAFATFLSYKPQNNSSLFYLKEYINALYEDCYSKVNPIYNKNNSSTEQFDSITYAKGACILQYLEYCMKPHKFREMIYNYLTKYKYSNASTNDFIEMIETVRLENNKINIKRLLNNLLSDNGYPLIKITKIENNKYKIEVKKFDILKNNFNDLPDYKNEFIIDIQHSTETIQYVINNNNIITDKILQCNPDSKMLCLILYENFYPELSIMNSQELLAYLTNQYMLLNYIKPKKLLDLIANILSNYDTKVDIYIITQISKILDNISRIYKILNNKFDDLKIKNSLLNLLDKTKDNEIFNKIINILESIYDVKMTKYYKYYNILNKYFIFIKYGNLDNFNKLIKKYNITEDVHHKKKIIEALSVNPNLWQYIKNKLKNRENELIIRDQDILQVIKLFINNNPIYIKELINTIYNPSIKLPETVEIRVHDQICDYIYNEQELELLKKVNKKIKPSQIEKIQSNINLKNLLLENNIIHDYYT